MTRHAKPSVEARHESSKCMPLTAPQQLQQEGISQAAYLGFLPAVLAAGELGCESVLSWIALVFFLLFFMLLLVLVEAGATSCWSVLLALSVVAAALAVSPVRFLGEARCLLPPCESSS